MALPPSPRDGLLHKRHKQEGMGTWLSRPDERVAPEESAAADDASVEDALLPLAVPGLPPLRTHDFPSSEGGLPF